MIETTFDCNSFKTENLQGDWIMHIVPVEDNVHPISCHPGIIFIKNILTKKIYYLAFNHPDSKPTINSSKFIQDVLLNNPNKKWVLDKKAFTQILHLPSVYDTNLISHWQDNTILDLMEYETPAHYLVKKNSAGYKNINAVIPLMKHKEMFDELADDMINIIKGYKIDSSFEHFNDLIIDTLGRLEAQGIYVNAEKFKHRFNQDPDASSQVYSQYNVYTSTGRPSNRFHNVNYAALNQTDGTRSCFCSRYGKDGKMVLIDYTAFHPRIICYLTKYDIPVGKDIYEYLAKLYFRKKNIDETDIKNAKQLTFRQFFGGVEEEYSHIKYLSNLKSFIAEQWNFFQNNGYVLTPIFKRKITSKHITDPNPPKVFNYILQASEGEISIPKVKVVLDYLQGKRTKAVLYTYDAVLYDFHKDDGYETLQELRRIMSFNGAFPMKTYIGDTYHDLKLITL